MTELAGAFLVLGFFALFALVRVPRFASEVISRARQALADMKDPALDDLAREKAVQAHSIRLMLLFVLVTGGTALALAVPIGVLWIAEQAGLGTVQAAIETTLTPAFLVGACVVGIALWLVARRREAGKQQTSE